MSSKTLKNNITYIFLGDAAVEQGSFYESLNFAVVNNLKLYLSVKIMSSQFIQIFHQGSQKIEKFFNLRKVSV